MSEFKAWWRSFSADEIQRAAEKLAAEAQALNPGDQVTIYFCSYSLGSAFAYSDYEFSNFNAAGVWIK